MNDLTSDLFNMSPPFSMSAFVLKKACFTKTAPLSRDRLRSQQLSP